MPGFGETVARVDRVHLSHPALHDPEDGVQLPERLLCMAACTALGDCCTRYHLSQYEPEVVMQLLPGGTNEYGSSSMGKPLHTPPFKSALKTQLSPSGL